MAERISNDVDARVPTAVSPIEAAEAEIRAELAALARRLGTATAPDAITIRVEFDRATGLPRIVDCQEERRRRIMGGTTVARKRCESEA
jgi:hypothetical protein